MAERTIKFIYNGQELIIRAQKDKQMKEIIQGYLTKIQKEQKDIYFLYNGLVLDTNKTLNEINSTSKEIVILAYDIINNDGNIDKEKETEINYSKDIICPTCGESSIVTFSVYKLNLTSCDNGHELRNILFENFKNSQKINEGQIKCNKCGNKKENTFDQKFYVCHDCKINLCPLCETKHNRSHKIFDYESKKYICKIHGEKMISFCNQCKKNLCDLCTLEHDKNHKIIYHREIIDNSKITNLEELRNKIDELKNEVDKIINDLNQFLNNLEIYYYINNNLVKHFNINNKNFQTLSNMKNLNDFNNKIIKDINDIIKEITVEKKFLFLEKVCIQMSGKFEISLKYNTEKGEDLTIFGKEFVEKNKNNFRMKIGKEIRELNYLIDKSQIKEKIFEIKLIQVKEINDLSKMFDMCSNLLSISDELNLLDTTNVTDMSCMFSSCSSLKSLPDISNWKTENVKKMYCMFSGCKSLLSFPDISKWDFSNVNSLGGIFIDCPKKISLPKLPEISLFGGYMLEKQFLKFLDIFKVSLLKEEKKENQFEINIGSKDINSASLQILSLDKNQCEKAFEISKDYLKNNQWMLSLNIEIKEETNAWEQLKPYINQIPIVKEKYEFKYRILGKKLYLDLISMYNNPYKEILKCLLETCELDLSLKSGFDATQLLKEISKDEKINESESSFFILLKSSKNISDILQLLYESSKEVNYNNKTIIQINDFNINHFKNKKCFEFTSEQINKYLSVFHNLYTYLKDLILSNLKPFLDGYGLTKEFINMKLDNVKLLFYSPDCKNGLSICLKINKITEVLEQLLN